MKHAKQIIAGLMIYFTVIGQVFGQAALLPNAEQQYLDNNGKPLASGTVTYYVPGTTQPKTTWQNSTQTVNNINPVHLDIGGKGIMYGQGSYRQVLKDNLGNVIWDQPTTAYGASQPSGATGTDTAPVGSVMAYSGFVVPTNWQLAYGQALSRTTFSALMTAITISAPSISCVNTSTTLTGFVDTSIIRVGAPIEATCLPTSTTVASITNTTTIVVSQAAAATVTVTAQIFPWGNGDQVTTFNVPDLRGRAPVGADCMGYVALGNNCAGNLTATYYGSNPGAAGQTGGTQSQTLTVANIAPFTPHGTISTFTPNGTVSVTSTVAVIQGGSVPTVNVTGGGGATVVTPAGLVAGSIVSTGASTVSPITPTFTGTSNGSNTPHSIVNPDATISYIIKVAANSTGAGGVVSFGGMFGDIVCASTLTCAPIGTVNTVGCTTATLSQLGCVQPDGTTVTINGSGILQVIAPVITALSVGSTSIIGGTNGDILYDNAGILGNFGVGTGVKTALGNPINASGGFLTYGTGARPKIPATTFFVDDINGNDSNACTSATTGACKTLNGAVAAIFQYDLNGSGITVNVAAPASSYSGMACLRPWVGQGTVTFVGNTTTPTNVVVAGGSSPAFDIENGCVVSLQGFSVTSTGNQSIQALFASRITMSAMDLGSAASGVAVVYATRLSYVEINDSIGPTTIHTGTAPLYLLEASHVAELRVVCTTACLSFTANATYTQFTILADDEASVVFTPSASFALNGFTVTSNKWRAISGAQIQINGNSPPLETSVPGTANSGSYSYTSVSTGPAVNITGGPSSSTSALLLPGGTIGVCLQKQDNSANTFCVDNSGNPSFPLAPLPVASGGTGGVTATAARSSLGAAASNAATTVAGQTCTLGSTCGLSSLTNSLVSNVNLTNVGYVDGPSVAQGTTGTWFASGSVRVAVTAGNVVVCKLWDGTTLISSTGGASNVTAQFAMSGIITSPAGNIRISCENASANSGTINATNGIDNNASTVTALRIN